MGIFLDLLIVFQIQCVTISWKFKISVAVNNAYRLTRILSVDAKNLIGSKIFYNNNVNQILIPWRNKINKLLMEIRCLTGNDGKKKMLKKTGKNWAKSSKIEFHSLIAFSKAMLNYLNKNWRGFCMAVCESFLEFISQKLFLYK